MEKKLSWEEIKELYDQEWVELIDYEWPEEAAHPGAGVVRVHAKDRKEFDRLAAIDPPVESAFVFVGEAALTPDSYLNTFRVLELR